MLNYLYCFDNNYNLQAVNSIYSILNNSSKKINIFVLHNDPRKFLFQSNLLKSHINLNSLKVIKFNKDDVNFPNLETTHVSEATYYRLYIEKHLSSKLDFLIYIDPDVVCLNNPEESLYKSIINLKKRNLTIGVRTESSSWTADQNDYKETFTRLCMKNSKYFNAGVMVINFKRWIQEDTTNKLIIKLHEIYDNIVLWDQDVMNSFFDGEYLELEDTFNFTVPIDVNVYNKITSTEKFNDIIFLHYAGKFKPWTVKGIFHPAAEYYQKNYVKFVANRYHIDNNWKPLALKDFIKSIFSLKFLKLDYPISYIISVMQYLLKNNDKVEK